MGIATESSLPKTSNPNTFDVGIHKAFNDLLLSGRLTAAKRLSETHPFLFDSLKRYLSRKPGSNAPEVMMPALAFCIEANRPDLFSWCIDNGVKLHLDESESEKAYKAKGDMGSEVVCTIDYSGAIITGAVTDGDVSFLKALTKRFGEKLLNSRTCNGGMPPFECAMANGAFDAVSHIMDLKPSFLHHEILFYRSEASTINSNASVWLEPIDFVRKSLEVIERRGPKDGSTDNDLKLKFQAMLPMLQTRLLMERAHMALEEIRTDRKHKHEPQPTCA